MDWLIEVLKYQRDHHVDGGVYKAVQCDFAYNSNHMEGSTLTHDQTVLVFERGAFAGHGSVNDLVEARNHFRVVDELLDHVCDPLTPELIRNLHSKLKRGTSDESIPVMNVGGYKLAPNGIASGAGFIETAAPEEVPALVDDLVDRWESSLHASDPIAEIARFHRDFELIHPFSDGNGRVGRLIMFKECLRFGCAPFIVTEDLKPFYLRGLREFDHEPGYLVDTLRTARDRFEAIYLPDAHAFREALAGTESPEAAPHAIRHER